MKHEIVFDYGDEGKITAAEPEEEVYEVFAKVKLALPCTGGVLSDEGPPIGSCGM